MRKIIIIETGNQHLDYLKKLARQTNLPLVSIPIYIEDGYEGELHEIKKNNLPPFKNLFKTDIFPAIKIDYIDPLEKEFKSPYPPIRKPYNVTDSNDVLPQFKYLEFNTPKGKMYLDLDENQKLIDFENTQK